jgi:hypothetical protein
MLDAELSIRDFDGRAVVALLGKLDADVAYVTAVSVPRANLTTSLWQRGHSDAVVVTMRSLAVAGRQMLTREG